ncbi:MAG: Sulfate-binding protein [Sodalis sp.]|nr:MAG: Sulfate-binding protein [Sodalis sp.]
MTLNPRCCHGALNYLYSTERQRCIVAQNYFCPSDAAVVRKYAKEFPTLKLFTLAKTFGD